MFTTGLTPGGGGRVGHLPVRRPGGPPRLCPAGRRRGGIAGV